MHLRPSPVAAARLGLGAVAALGAMILTAPPVAAQVAGPCTATGYEASANTAAKDLAKGGATSTIDINQSSDWHVHKGAYISGNGTSTVKQKHATVNVDVFGLPIPIVNANGDGGSGGDAGPFKVDDFAKFTKTIDVSGDSDSCTGSLTITVDDQSAASTIAGGAALGMTVLGALGTLGVALRKR